MYLAKHLRTFGPPCSSTLYVLGLFDLFWFESHRWCFWRNARLGQIQNVTPSIYSFFYGITSSLLSASVLTWIFIDLIIFINYMLTKLNYFEILRLFSHDVVILFTIYEFDCPSDMCCLFLTSGINYLNCI